MPSRNKVNLGTSLSSKNNVKKKDHGDFRKPVNFVENKLKE